MGEDCNGANTVVAYVVLFFVSSYLKNPLNIIKREPLRKHFYCKLQQALKNSPHTYGTPCIFKICAVIIYNLHSEPSFIYLFQLKLSQYLKCLIIENGTHWIFLSADTDTDISANTDSTTVSPRLSGWLGLEKHPDNWNPGNRIYL